MPVPVSQFNEDRGEHRPRGLPPACCFSLRENRLSHTQISVSFLFFTRKLPIAYFFFPDNSRPFEICWALGQARPTHCTLFQARTKALPFSVVQTSSSSIAWNLDTCRCSATRRPTDSISMRQLGSVPVAREPRGVVGGVLSPLPRTLMSPWTLRMLCHWDYGCLQMSLR